ncbi:hypothetical protein GCM10028789_27360 [Sinomonas halotolerans]
MAFVHLHNHTELGILDVYRNLLRSTEVYRFTTLDPTATAWSRRCMRVGDRASSLSAPRGG